MGADAYASTGDLAVLADPQRSGVCVDIGLARAAGGAVDLSAWPTPSGAPCTGRAALSAAEFVTGDPRAGG
ncbi:hypothetical protein [Streptacidiphilus anmyonensis]|uniref:hypothetical protein n=1 Tax=Streptacidiphilus anmyonensis TaxID=405782 RepID=UPI0005A73189|nr:hypothetical protein [Streptacidiphilus anmyonensis]